MPTYNRAHIIKRAIKSILDQSVKDFELIIIDDGSTDNTKQAILDFRDRRIAYLKRKHIGVSAARNLGLKVANGEYIAYCDDDDILYHNHLKSLSHILDKYRQVGLVYANYIIKKPKHPDKILATEFNRWALEVKDICGPPMNVMHKKECTRKVGGFNESASMDKHAREDHDLWLRISESFKCYHLNETLGEHTFYSLGRCNKIDFAKAYVYIILKRWNKYKNNNQTVDYINNCAFPIIKRMIFELGLKDYAFRLTKDFYKASDSGVTLACLGLYSYSEGDFESAIKKLESSLKLCGKENEKYNPSFKVFRINIKTKLARAYFEIGKIGKAMNICELLLKNLDNAVDAAEIKQLYTRCLLEKRQHNKALKYLSKMDATSSWFLRAACYFQQKKYHKTAGILEKLLLKEKNKMPVHYNLALAYMFLKKYRKAIKQLNEALKISPDNDKARRILARLKLGMRDFPLSPKVSVIMCTYNRAHMIKRSIKSVLGQSFKNFELIIINDGSKDTTKQIVNSFKDKRIVYLEKSHGGAPAARNFGLKLALGKYIAYLDDDDVFFRNHLSEMSNFLSTHTDTGLVYGDTIIEHKKLKISQIRRIPFDKNALEMHCLPLTCSLMHTTEVLKSSGLFNKTLVCCSDWEMWLRISDCCKINRMPKITAARTYHDSNISMTDKPSKFYRKIICGRISKAKKENKLNDYINGPLLGIIKNLAESPQNIDYAQKLSNALFVKRNNYLYRACKGVCYFSRGHLNKALTFLGKSLELLSPGEHRNIEIVLLYLARTQYLMDSIVEAKTNCSKLLKLNPDNFEARLLFSKCLLKEGNHTRDLRMLSPEKSNNFYMYLPELYNLRGCAYFSRENYGRAAEEFYKASTLNPKTKHYRHNLEIAYAKQNKA